MSKVEPKHINDVMEDKNWVKAMQEELEQFQKNDIWKLVELPQGKKAMGAKWVFRNKLDAAGKVVRNMVWKSVTLKSRGLFYIDFLYYSIEKCAFYVHLI